MGAPWAAAGWGRRAVVAVERAPVPRVLGLGRDTSIFVWTWFIWGIGAGLWSYFWPVYLARLGADPVQVGLVVGIGGLVATAVYLPGGFVAQLGGHKWQLVIAHALATVATASFGLAQTWWHVVPGVIASNLIAVFSPAIHSFIAQTADDDGVPASTAFSTITAAQYVTMTISPPIGGWIADRFGMATLFPLVAIAYGVSAAGMSLIRSRPMPRLDTAGDGGGATTRVSAWASGGSAYASLFRSRRVLLLLLTAFLVHAAVHLALSFAPLFLRTAYNYDAAGIGWAGSAASAGAAVILVGITRFRRRFGPVPAMLAACGLIGAHFGATVASAALVVQLAGFFCRGGVQAMSTLTTVALTELVPRARLAPAVALMAAAAGLASILAPPIGGWLYAHSPVLPFVGGALGLAVALPLVVRAYATARPS
jgi:MFS family permease